MGAVVTEVVRDQFALLAFKLARDDESTEEIAEHRRGLRQAMTAHGGVDEVASYESLPGAGNPWMGGVDIVLFSAEAAFDAAAAEVGRQRRRFSPSRVYGAKRFAVRPCPVDGVHTFARGGLEIATTRDEWQAYWRGHHAEIIETATEYAPYLKGYEQYHAVPTQRAASLGLDDTNGVAHMTYASTADREHALALPDYISVLRADEDRFVNRNGGMRVFARRTGTAAADDRAR
jgi:hypothetical protein